MKAGTKSSGPNSAANPEDQSGVAAASPEPEGRQLLPVTNPEDLAEALALPRDELIDLLDDFFRRQAAASEEAVALCEQIEAAAARSTRRLLQARLRRWLRTLDDGTCTAGGYCEALLVRLSELQRDPRVPRSAEAVSIASADKASMALLRKADLEIQASATYLREYIEGTRSGITDVARGVLLRIAELSEIMVECAGGYGDDVVPLEELRQRVGLPAELEEADHAR